MYACCFVTINTVTYSTCLPECQILFFNFDLLHTVRNSWPVFQRKLSRRRLLITVVYFVSHTSARALRLITFTQRSRTTRHLFSIQFLWKPKILNVKDKRTKFERSKGDLGQFSESCNWPLTRAQLNKHMVCVVLRSWWMEAITAGLRQSVTSLVYELCTDMLFQPHYRLNLENSFVQSSEFLICKLRSKRRVSSDHAGMKNISAEVSIFCLWTNWIHLVTCSKIEFRELHCCSRCFCSKEGSDWSF